MNYQAVLIRTKKAKKQDIIKIKDKYIPNKLCSLKTFHCLILMFILGLPVSFCLIERILKMILFLKNMLKIC